MKIDFKVTKKQAAFINAEADEILFGGAAGGGKSYGQLIDAFLYAMKYKGSKQILFRRTYPELEKSIIRTALQLYPKELCSYHKTSHSITFLNGSLLDFGYIDSETDVFKYQSAEYDVIRFDELTHFSEQMYVYMISRLRGANDFPKSMRSTTNPGGVGHTWVKARFIDIGAAGVTHQGESGSRVFIPSLVTDNKYLMEKDPKYIQRLQNLDERDRKALLEGCWDITEGLFFSEVKRGLQIVSAFDIPTSWNRYFVMDYGLDMLAGYLIAVSEQGWCYVYRELYEGKDSGGEGLIVSEAAKRIRELIGSDTIKAYYAPPDMWNRQKDSGKSIAQLFYEQGVRFEKTQNDRRHGWFVLKEMLKECKDESGQAAAKLRIFASCINLVRCLTSIQVSPKDTEDVADTPHELTHSVDALRYFASAHYRAPVPPKPRPTYNFEFEKPKNGFGKGEKVQII